MEIKLPLNQMVIKIIWKHKIPEIANAMLSKKEMMELLLWYPISNYATVIVTKTEWYCLISHLIDSISMQIH
jgi:hypothetical protein